MTRKVRKQRKKGLPQGIRPIPDVAKDPSDRPLVFSFKYFDDSCDTYSLTRCDARNGYVSQLMPRLRELSRMTVLEFKSNRSNALRSHPINWDTVANHNDFGIIPAADEQMYAIAQEEAYQFSLTANEYGRVAGFFRDNVFHVVWLDPDHLLYPQA